MITIPMRVNADTVSVPMRLSSDDVQIQSSIGVAVEIVQAHPYEGEYHFTPSPSAITVQTGNKYLAEDITIDPIPSNYGLITWNGAYLTVS